MKKFSKYILLALLVLLFVASCVLVACDNNDEPPTPAGKVTVTFDSGVDALSIPAQTFDKGGKATKPTVDATYKVFGWYTTSACVTEFDFSKAVNNDVTVYGRILKGEGSVANPFEVGSAQALNVFANYGSQHDYVGKLVADVTYTSTVTANYSATVFNGTLDGNGHTITLQASNTGIFYKLGATATVKNLKVVGHIEAAVGSCGVVANHNYGTITSVTTEGTEIHRNSSGKVSNGFADGIYSVSGQVGIYTDALATENTDAVGGAGGIVGTNYKDALIKDCTNNMNVRAVVGGGGMAAVNYGTIDHCFNNGCVGTTGDTSCNLMPAYNFSYLGGMTGINFGTIKNCGNLNKVYAHRRPDLLDMSSFTTNMRKNIGGIAGYNVGEVDDGVYVGGVITECFNYGRIHGDMIVGGIAGESSGSITYCASYGLYGARGYLGGIVGFQTDDAPGVVSYCSTMMRIDSDAPTTAIKDPEGNSYDGVSLEDLDSKKDIPSNVVEFYKVAKYADHCAYHNNCGNIAPIDPATNDKGSNKATKGSEIYNAFSVLNTAEKDIWVEDKGANQDYVTNSIVAINKNYQIYLNVYLAWQKATITAVGLDGSSTTVDARQGINYTQAALGSKTGDDGLYWSKSNSKRNLSGFLPNTGLPTQTAPEGKIIIWTTVQNDASTVWNGICTGDITLYAMVVDKPAT